jgi:hypothetical protein
LGRGWLVLAGGDARDSGEVRALALRKLKPDGHVAYVSLGESDDAMIDDLADLGAPAGYQVDVLREDDDTIRDLINEAALVVLPPNYSARELRAVIAGAAVEAIMTAYDEGAVILAEGPAATVFGAIFVDSDGTPQEGLQWLEGAVILSGIASITESEQARALLSSQTATVAVGLASDAALALGPEGLVETIGSVTIALAGGG